MPFEIVQILEGDQVVIVRLAWHNPARLEPMVSERFFEFGEHMEE